MIPGPGDLDPPTDGIAPRPGEPDVPDPVATMLRQVLHRQAEAVRPAPALDRILARANAPGQAPPSMRRPARAGRFSRWLPAVAAAAVVAVLVAGLGTTRAWMVPLSMRGSLLGSGPVTSSHPVPALPVYLLEVEQDRWALVREFVPTTETDRGHRLTAALRLAVAGTGDDPNLVTAWSTLGLTGDVRGSVTAAGITVRLSSSLLDDTARAHQAPEPARSGATLTRFALQQLVWTAQAVVGMDVPVRVEGPDAASVLFHTQQLGQVVPRQTGPDDPRAPVWLSSVTNGERLPRGPATISGDAITTASGTVAWMLGPVGGTTGTVGVARLVSAGGGRPQVGERATFQIQLVLPGPGRYQLSITQDWPSASDPSATWTDTKTLVVA